MKYKVALPFIMEDYWEIVAETPEDALLIVERMDGIPEGTTRFVKRLPPEIKEMPAEETK